MCKTKRVRRCSLHGVCGPLAAPGLRLKRGGHGIRTDPAIHVIEFPDRGNILRFECKIEHRKIFLYAVCIHRFWDNDHVAIDMPTNDDLRRCTFMLPGNALYDRVGQKSSAAQWAPRLGLYSALSVRLAQPPLLKARMQLDLVKHGCYAGFANYTIKMLDLEVGNTNGPRKPLFAGPDKGAPCICVKVAAGRWPVNQTQIDKGDLQALQA